MSDHLIAEADRHAKALPTTNPTHADIAWYVREVSELRAILASIEEDGTEEHNAAVSLRQELATERARLRIVEEFMLRRHIPQAEDDYPQIWLGNGYFDTLADAADAAMKEDTK